MLIRHLNRGDVKEGGCPLCKPRHRRFEHEAPPFFLVEEGLAEYDETRKDPCESNPLEDHHSHPGR